MQPANDFQTTNCHFLLGNISQVNNKSWFKTKSIARLGRQQEMRKYWQRLLKIIRSNWKRYIQAIIKMNEVDIDEFKNKY